eukprot:1224881-Amphidinium_carterae.1
MDEAVPKVARDLASGCLCDALYLKHSDILLSTQQAQVACVKKQDDLVISPRPSPGNVPINFFNAHMLHTRLLNSELLHQDK